MQQDMYGDILPGRGGSAASTSLSCGREAKPRKEGHLSHTLHSLSLAGCQRGGQNMLKWNKPGEHGGYTVGIYRGDKSHLAWAVDAECPFLIGSLQCPLFSERQGPPKSKLPCEGFKYQALGEQLGPAPPGPLPGWMGLVRVRER